MSKKKLFEDLQKKQDSRENSSADKQRDMDEKRENLDGQDRHEQEDREKSKQ